MSSRLYKQTASSYLDWNPSRVQVLTCILSIIYSDSVSGLAHRFINEPSNSSNIDCYVSHSANTIYDYWNLQLWKYKFLKLNKSRWITPTLFNHYITLSQHKLTNGPEQKCRQICLNMMCGEKERAMILCLISACFFLNLPHFEPIFWSIARKTRKGQSNYCTNE